MLIVIPYLQNRRRLVVFWALSLLLVWSVDASAKQAIEIDYVHFRPVVYETENAFEPVNEQPNQGGLVFAYLRNASDKVFHLNSWSANGKGGSSYRLTGAVAWDRLLERNLAPGAMTVLEICAVSADFQQGKKFHLSLSGRGWPPGGWIKTSLKKDPIQITFLRVYRDMKTVDVFVQNHGSDSVEVLALEIANVGVEEVRWSADSIDPACLAIARASLSGPLHTGQTVIAKVKLRDKEGERIVCGHRTAFPDRFPIGTWGAEPDTYAITRQHHIDTLMKGGSPTDPFYSQDAAKFGFHSMVHTGVYPNVDQIRNLSDHPVVNCWYLQDEPDWNKTPQMIFTSAEATHRIDRSKPTLVNLCRNVQFMKYAFITDIAGHDHYCVTAPTTSRWPHLYGTRLEETAYYTRDLRYATYPKPTWVWTQGIFNWDERPKRPVPTPEEAAAQLLFNVGRGAKGILWFTFKKSMGERYPDLREAVQGWNRVLVMTREDLLSSEPAALHVRCPKTVDVAPLVAWERIFLPITNVDYKIDDEAYQWTQAQEVKISLDLPPWIEPKSCIALAPEGPSEISFKAKTKSVSVKLDALEAVRFLVLDNDPKALDRYEASYGAAKQVEIRAF